MFNRDGSLMKLGKRPVVLDRRADKSILQFRDYRLLPTAPVEVSWITKLVDAESLPMYLNNELGTCVPAAAGHMIQQWSYYAGHSAQPSDADILTAYEAVGGYVPGSQITDNGCDMLDFLKYWQATGVGGHKIISYMAVDWTNAGEVQAAIEIFGNLFTGFLLPTAVQGRDDWTVVRGGVYTEAGMPGGWGGHCVPLMARSPMTDTCVTWATRLKMSHNFALDYMDEAFVVLSQDWIEFNGLSPSSLDLAALEYDFGQLDVSFKPTAFARRR
jgi:hypothetical protein